MLRLAEAHQPVTQNAVCNVAKDLKKLCKIWILQATKILSGWLVNLMRIDPLPQQRFTHMHIQDGMRPYNGKLQGFEMTSNLSFKLETQPARCVMPSVNLFVKLGIRSGSGSCCHQVCSGGFGLTLPKPWVIYQ